MPLYALIGRDKEDGLQYRLDHRPAHLEHMARLDAEGRIRYGGPLLNESGKMAGSLIVIEAENLASAQATFADDPYVIHGIFENCQILETTPIFPRGN